MTNAGAHGKLNEFAPEGADGLERGWNQGEGALKALKKLEKSS